MIGRVGTMFGEEGVNIVSAAVGAEPGGESAVMALTTDAPVRARDDRQDPRARRLLDRPLGRSLDRRQVGSAPVKAVVLTGTGGYDVLQVQERPDPPVGPGEVRIAVKAAGINFADTMARVGLYPDAPKPPCVLGYEVAGEVESVGEGVSELAGRRPGRRPAPASAARPSWSPSPRRRRCRCPSGLSFEQGAAFPVNYGTAYAALIVMGSLREGDRVLIHAAGGRRRHLRHADRPQRRRRDLRHRLALQARGDPRPGRRPPDRLPHRSTSRPRRCGSPTARAST